MGATRPLGCRMYTSTLALLRSPKMAALPVSPDVAPSTVSLWGVLA